MSDTVKVVDTGPGAYFCGYEERTLAPGEKERIAREWLTERVRSWRDGGEEWMMVWGSSIGPSPSTLLSVLFGPAKEAR
jgi:hypothetical protein